MRKYDTSPEKEIMDSSEDVDAQEERSSTTNDAPPSAVQTTAIKPTAAGATEGVCQHILSTSRIQMEMLPLRDYIMDLSEEEWNSFADAMSNPLTKLQFLTVCLDVAKYVTLSALTIIIPSLARRLGEDPNLLTPSEESHGHVNIIGTSSKSPSVIYVEDDEDIIELNKGVLTKFISKAGSRSSLRSCDESPLSSHSSSEKR
ncbi:uncharacterized protein LOC134063461 [Sardina pilchardus]|uniref:uncharacterized protein LOC134063461 n=1 Tax=Sardina pilchardus TaxID=27697 RepID=UPI002E0D2043